MIAEVTHWGDVILGGGLGAGFAMIIAALGMLDHERRWHRRVPRDWKDRQS